MPQQNQEIFEGCCAKNGHVNCNSKNEEMSWKIGACENNHCPKLTYQAIIEAPRNVDILNKDVMSKWDIVLAMYCDNILSISEHENMEKLAPFFGEMVLNSHLSSMRHYELIRIVEVEQQIKKFKKILEKELLDEEKYEKSKSEFIATFESVTLDLLIANSLNCVLETKDHSLTKYMIEAARPVFEEYQQKEEIEVFIEKLWKLIRIHKAFGYVLRGIGVLFTKNTVYLPFSPPTTVLRTFRIPLINKVFCFDEEQCLTRWYHDQKSKNLKNHKQSKIQYINQVPFFKAIEVSKIRKFKPNNENSKILLLDQSDEFLDRMLSPRQKKCQPMCKFLEDYLDMVIIHTKILTRIPNDEIEKLSDNINKVFEILYYNKDFYFVNCDRAHSIIHSQQVFMWKQFPDKSHFYPIMQACQSFNKFQFWQLLMAERIPKKFPSTKMIFDWFFENFEDDYIISSAKAYQIWDILQRFVFFTLFKQLSIGLHYQGACKIYKTCLLTASGNEKGNCGMPTFKEAIKLAGRQFICQNREVEDDQPKDGAEKIKKVKLTKKERKARKIEQAKRRSESDSGSVIFDHRQENFEAGNNEDEVENVILDDQQPEQEQEKKQENKSQNEMLSEDLENLKEKDSETVRNKVDEKLISSYEEEKKNLENQVESLKIELYKEQKAHKQLKLEIGRKDKRIKNLEDAKKRDEKEAEKLVQKIEESKSEIKDLKEKTSNDKEIIRSLDSELAKEKKMKHNLEMDTKKKNEKINELEKFKEMYENERKTNEHLKIEIIKLKKDAEKAKNLAEHRKFELDNKISITEKLKQEINEKDLQIEELEEAKKEFESAMRNTKHNRIKKAQESFRSWNDAIEERNKACADMLQQEEDLRNEKLKREADEMLKVVLEHCNDPKMIKKAQESVKKYQKKWEEIKIKVYNNLKKIKDHPLLHYSQLEDVGQLPAPFPNNITEFIKEKRRELEEERRQKRELEDKTCLICREEHTEFQLTTKCNCCLLRYHSECLSKWLKINPTCTVCKTLMIDQNEFPSLK